MERYEKYKDSGIEWIGEIPEHWEVRNLQIVATKERYSFTGGPFGSDLKANEYTQTGVRIIQLQNIGVGEFLDDYKIYTSEEKADDLFSCNIFPNEVIVAKMADPVARACLMPDYDERYLMASDGIRIKVSDEVANSKYVVYSMNSPYFKAQAEINSEGTTRLRIGLNALKKLKVILPSVQEQITISTYLDRKTAEIDRIIANKQKLIALYEEEKQAIINQAVTKGLDPNVILKDTGVEWLGEIPEHWSLIKLKRISIKITDGEHISPNFTLEGMPFLSAKDVRDGYVQFDYEKFVSIEDGENFRKRCNPEVGDILIVSRGATVGRVAIVETDEKFCLLGSVILIKPTSIVLSRFILFCFKNKLLLDNFLLTSQSSAQQALYLVNVAEIFLSLPSIQEQKSIIDYIGRECSRLDTIIEKFNKQIDLLKEYRTTLISEVVTGKIMVPENENK